MIKSRKFISLLLVLVMALSLMPMSVWAEEATPEEAAVVEETTVETAEKAAEPAEEPAEEPESSIPEETVEEVLPEETAEENFAEEPMEETAAEETEQTEDAALTESAETVPEEATGEETSSSGTTQEESNPGEDNQEENNENDNNPAEKEYRVDYWDMDQCCVKVNGQDIKSGVKSSFAKDEELSFTLIPPQNEELKDIEQPYRVEVEVNGKESQKLTVNGLNFTYTPTTTDGFIIRVYWEEGQYVYDTYGPNDVGFYTLNLHWDGDAAVDFADETISSCGYYNNLRTIVATDATTLDLMLDPFDDWYLQEVRVDGNAINFADCYNLETGVLTLSLEEYNSWDQAHVDLNFARPPHITIYYDANALDVKNGENVAENESCWTYNDEGQIEFTITPKDDNDFYGIYAHWWPNEDGYEFWLSKEEAEIAKNADGSYTLTIDYEYNQETKDYDGDIELISNSSQPFNNEYVVECDERDEAEVEVNEDTISAWVRTAFTEEQELSFTLTPPQNEELKGIEQPYRVEVEVNGKESQKLTVNGLNFTYTPTTTDGFIIRVYWNEAQYNYDTLEPEEDGFYTVDLNWDGDARVELANEELSHGYYFNNLRTILSTEESSLVLKLTPNGDWFLREARVDGQNIDLEECYDSETGELTLPLGEHESWDWTNVELLFAEPYKITIEYDTDELSVNVWNGDVAELVNPKDNTYLQPGVDEVMKVTVTPKEGDTFYGIQMVGYGDPYISEYTSVNDCVTSEKCTYDKQTGSYTFTIPHDESVNYDMYIYFYSDKDWFELDSYEPGEDEGAVTVWAEGVGQIDEVWLDDKKVDEENMRRADNALRFLVPADTDEIFFVVSNGEYTYKLNQVIDVSGEENVPVKFTLTDDVCAIAVEDILQENQAYYWLGLEFSPRLTVEYDDEQLNVKIRNGEELETVDLEDNVYLQPGVEEYMEFTVTPKEGEDFYGIRLEGYGDYFCEYTSAENCVKSKLCDYDQATNTYTFYFDYDEDVWYDMLIHFYGAEGWFELDSYEPGEGEGAITVWAEGIGQIDEVWLDDTKVDEEDIRRADNALRFPASADTEEISFKVSNNGGTYKLNQVINMLDGENTEIDFDLENDICTIQVADILQEDQAYYWLDLKFSNLMMFDFDGEQYDVNWIQTWNGDTAVSVDPEDNGYIQPGVDEQLVFTVTPKEGEKFYGICVTMDDEEQSSYFSSVADCISEEGGGAYNADTNTYTLCFDYHDLDCDFSVAFAECTYNWNKNGSACTIRVGYPANNYAEIPASDVSITSTIEGDCQHEAIKTCTATYEWEGITLTDSYEVKVDKGNHNLGEDGKCTVEGCNYVKPGTQLQTVNTQETVSESVAGIDSTEKETVATILADTLNEEAETNTELKKIKEDIADGKVQAVTSVNVAMKTGQEVDDAIKETALNNGLSDVVVAGCFEVDIEIKNEDSGETLATLTETSQPITITVVLTAAMAQELQKQLDEGQAIYVMREHQESYDLLPATLKGNVLTFSSDKFSEFSVLALNPESLINNSEIKVKDLLGDTDGNGQITTMDLIRLVKYLLNSITQSELCCDADVNGDGEFNLADLVYLLKQLMTTSA